mgnify:CR=1 FL=1
MTLFDLATTKEGSIHLQNRLHLMGEEELASVVDTLAPDMVTLARHGNANYLVSALWAFGYMHDKVDLFAAPFCQLMVHKHASHVMQNMFQCVPRSKVLPLLEGMRGNVFEIAKTKYGTWTVSSAYMHTRAEFIRRELCEHMYAVSTHPAGSRAMQKVIKAGYESCFAHALLRMDAAQLAALARDEYGNYVVQLVIEGARPDELDGMIALLAPVFPQMSTELYGSHVAEAIVHASSAQQLADVAPLMQQVPCLGFARHVRRIYGAEAEVVKAVTRA